MSELHVEGHNPWNKQKLRHFFCLSLTVSADHTGHQRMELLLPPHPEPAIPLPPSHPYLATNYPRKYDLRLTSEQGANRVRNLYAFRERMEGGEDDDDDIIDSDGEDDQKGKGQADEDKSRGRRKCCVDLT